MPCPKGDLRPLWKGAECDGGMAGNSYTVKGPCPPHSSKLRAVSTSRPQDCLPHHSTQLAPKDATSSLQIQRLLPRMQPTTHIVIFVQPLTSFT